MKAIVHIGIEKTGTTSIQKCLYRNRKTLQKAGYHFIQSAGKKNHQAIPAFCLPNETGDDFFRLNGIDSLEKRDAYRKGFTARFAAELNRLPSTVHTVIISSEHFHSRIRTEQAMDNVHSFLTQYFDDIRIICYLREQAATCSSYYSTYLMAGGDESFDAFSQRCVPGNYHFNHDTLLANWTRCFGAEALDVSLFSRAAFVNADLLQDFITKIDPALTDPVDTSTRVENESLTPGGQALLRAVNGTFADCSDRTNVAKLQNKCRKMIHMRLKGTGRQFSLRKRQEIYDKFLHCNQQVQHQFFGSVDRGFAPPVESEAREIEISDAFLDTYTAVLNVLKKAGRKVVTENEIAGFNQAVGQSWADISAHGDDEGSIGQIALKTDDARALERVASGSGKGSSQLPYEIRALADKIDDTLPGLGGTIGRLSREK